MSNLPLVIYLIGILGSLNIIITLIVTFSLLSLFCALFVYAICSDDDLRPQIKNSVKPIVIVCVISSLVGTFLPDTKTAWMILGAKTAIELQDNPDFQRTSKNLLNLINAKMIEATKTKSN